MGLLFRYQMRRMSRLLWFLQVLGVGENVFILCPTLNPTFQVNSFKYYELQSFNSFGCEQEPPVASHLFCLFSFQV
jgi:hypothetical protein